MAYFAGFVLRRRAGAWRWRGARIGKIAARMPACAVGPYGLPYIFWASAQERRRSSTRSRRGCPKVSGRRRFFLAFLASHPVFLLQGRFSGRRRGRASQDRRIGAHDAHEHGGGCGSGRGVRRALGGGCSSDGAWIAMRVGVRSHVLWQHLMDGGHTARHQCRLGRGAWLHSFGFRACLCVARSSLDPPGPF